MLGNQFRTKPSEKFKNIFSKVDSIARKTKLVVRISPKFTASAFLLTLLKTVATGKASYNEMASTLENCDLKPMSRQAFSVRLVAIRAEKHVAEKRRRDRIKAAKKNGKTPSKKSLYRDGWHIMVTNVEKDKMDVEDLVKLYSLRWQIEITFRAWKQSGELMKALNRKSKPSHLRTLIYASILWLVISMKTAAILQSGLNKNKQVVSLQKLAMSMISYIMKLTYLDELSKCKPHLRRVLIERRKRDSLMAVGIQCLS